MSPPGPADSVYTLPEVRVERERALAGARRRLPTAFVTDLRAGTAGRALESLSEVLAEAAGVHVAQYGGLGAFSTVSLRGAPPGQVAVFLDGAPLTSAAHGIVSLSDLPATAVERVEVYRGLAPLGLGVATPGGAINLITVSAPGLRELHLGRGSFGTWEGRGTGGFERGPLALLAHAGYQGSRGDFRYHDDNGTPLNLADDSLGTRVNDRFDAWSALASATWRPRPGLSLRLREDVFHKAQGLSGLGATPALSPRLSFLRALSLAQAAREGTRLVPRVELRGSANRERSRFRDTRLPDRGELGVGRHDTDDRLAGDELTLALAWPAALPWLALETAGSLSRERAGLTDAADGRPDPPESRRSGHGAVASLDLRPAGGRLVLHAARRWDRIEDHLRSVGPSGLPGATDLARELSSPQLGARIAVGWGLELRANWAEAERAPAFLELFGNQGSVLGNPSLRPEAAENRDAGAAWSGAVRGFRAATEWARYGSDARDLVLYVRNSASSVKAQNFSRARIRGEEWSARLEAPAGLTLAGAFTWQSAINLGPTPAFWVGKRLPQRPGRQGYGRLGWRPASGALRRLGLHLGADLQYIGDDYLDPYNRQRVPSRTLAGAWASLAPFVWPLRVTVEGKNLGDDRVADVAGFPLPGRSVFASCALRLGGPEPTSRRED
ncbi:MAG: TonB-dependent receptor [Candidatus Eisenbacteria bacterium]|nr:TonB-dependent receptor [Candidatus Eisenbacteria bacterium]